MIFTEKLHFHEISTFWKRSGMKSCVIFFDGYHFCTSESPVVQYFSDIQNTTQMRMRAKSRTTVDSDHLIYTSAPIQRSMLL